SAMYRRCPIMTNPPGLQSLEPQYRRRRGAAQGCRPPATCARALCGTSRSPTKSASCCPARNLDLAERDKYGPRGFGGRRSVFYSGQWFSSGVGSMVDPRDDEPGKNRSDDQPLTGEAALSARLSHLDQRLSHIRKDRAFEKGQAGAEEQSTHA